MYQRIQMSGLSQGRRHGVDDRRRDGDVAADPARSATRVGQFRSERPSVFRPGGDEDVCAVERESACYSLPHTAAGPGDQDRVTIQCHGSIIAPPSTTTVSPTTPVTSGLSRNRVVWAMDAMILSSS